MKLFIFALASLAFTAGTVRGQRANSNLTDIDPAQSDSVRHSLSLEAYVPVVSVSNALQTAHIIATASVLPQMQVLRKRLE